MEIKPKLSVTGYRGIWGDSLDEKIAFEYARAFAKLITQKTANKTGIKVIIGRDARKGGPEIYQAAKQALEKENIQVVYADILPTPTMLLLVNKLSYDGGIMVTASHNPPEYNGMKFIMPGAMLTNAQEVGTMETFRTSLTEEEKSLSPLAHKEERIDNKTYREIHIKEVLENVDGELIKSKKFNVCLDPINSAGSVITEELLCALDCTVHIINGTQDGNFAHMPEPLAKNLIETAAFVANIKPDIGFVQDPDADRLVLIDEQGNVILEELTIALAMKSVLSRENKTSGERNVVTNMSTTQVCADVAHEYESIIYRTKVGEAHVVQKMIETKAVIGGEGSGGVIYPPVGLFRDSLSGIALILELMARENRKISEIVASLPKYYMKKDNIPLRSGLEEFYKKLEARYPEAAVNTEDGIRLDWPDETWIQARASNTEPIMRIFGEAKTENRIEEIFTTVRALL